MGAIQDEHQVERVLIVENRLNGLNLGKVSVNARHLLGEVELLVNFNVVLLLLFR
jgi:hypothetical protein